MTTVFTRQTTATGADNQNAPLTNAQLDANFINLNNDKQPVDADLTAIAALTGTTGLLRKTAANTWSLDTTAYTTNTGTVTEVTGTAPVVSSGGTAPVISMAAATASVNGYMTSTYAAKLDGIAAGANNYSHPASHPPSIITQDASNRFVTDAEKTAWNAKLGDAPSDGKTYGRKDAAWAEVVAGGGDLIRSARTSNTMIAAADKGKLIDITSGTFTQTFAAAATLGAGWWCYIANNGTGVITLDPNSTEQIDGGTTLAMHRGEVRLIHCDGSALRSFLFRGRPILVACDEKVVGASGGSVLPPYTRTLNTVRTNTIHGASLASNQITLPAGVYLVSAQAPVNNSSVAGHRLTLYNATTSSTILEGSSGSVIGTGGGNNTHSFLVGQIVLTATSAIELRHLTGSTTYGNSSSQGSVEIYSQIQIEKIA